MLNLTKPFQTTWLHHYNYIPATNSYSLSQYLSVTFTPNIYLTILISAH